MNREEFITAVKELGISITDKQLEQLNKYTSFSSVIDVRFIFLFHSTRAL